MSDFLLDNKLELEGEDDNVIIKVKEGKFKGYNFSFLNVSLHNPGHLDFTFHPYTDTDKFDEDELTQFMGDILVYMLSLNYEEVDSEVIVKCHDDLMKHFD